MSRRFPSLALSLVLAGRLWAAGPAAPLSPREPGPGGPGPETAVAQAGDRDRCGFRPGPRPGTPAVEAEAPGPDAPAFTVTPMLGGVGGNGGFGIDVSLGLEYLSLGLRYAASEELCMFCEDAESESQTAVLGGVRFPFPIGSLSARAGIAAVRRVTKDNFVSNGGFFADPQYDLRTFDGTAIPLELDLQLGARFVGISLSLMTLIDEDGGSNSLMIGMPLGYLHP